MTSQRTQFSQGAAQQHVTRRTAMQDGDDPQYAVKQEDSIPDKHGRRLG